MNKAILLLSILALLNVSCRFDSSVQYTCQGPENINDGFNVGTLEEVNMKAALIERSVNKIYAGRFKEVHSMLIFKDNRLVFEEYFQGHQYRWDAPYHHGDWVTWDRNMPHRIMSATKFIFLYHRPSMHCHDGYIILHYGSQAAPSEGPYLL